MIEVEILDSPSPLECGYKVDVTQGERIGRVSSEWFARPADERYLSLSELMAAVLGRAERCRTRTVESGAVRVEASRDDPERLRLLLPGSDRSLAPTHWSFGQLAALAGTPAAYVRPEDELPIEPEPDPAADDAGAQSEAAAANDALHANDDSADALEPEEDEGLRPLSDRLLTELTAFRTVALRDALGGRPDIAYLAALHALTLQAFYPYALDSCLELVRKSVGFSVQSPGLDDSAAAVAIRARHAKWAARLPKEAEDLWGMLSLWDEGERQALFAHVVADSVNAVHELWNRRPRAMAHADALAASLALDLAAAGWTPSADNFLGRVTKPRILAAVAEANPGGFSMLRPADRAVAAAARELGADALVSGTGGDNVFCSLRSPAPVIDGWRIGGLAGAVRAGRDLARITQTGPWQVAHQSRAYLKVERANRVRWRASHDLLAPDCQPSFAGHPWLDSPKRRLAGSRAQIVMLLRAHAVTAAHDRARGHDMIFPLLAQPILEACLAIASPHWIAGGQDRSVAREAFRQDLPSRTIGRRSKGRRDGLVARVFDQHRRKIGERLVDGRLAAAGLIDRAAICAIAARPSSPDDRYMRLLELLDAELWLDSLYAARSVEI